MRCTKGGVITLSVATATLLGLLWTWLPPLHTADIVGIVSTVAAHILVTLVADWLLHCNRPTYTVVGTGAVAALYWLATVCVAVVWRLLLLVDTIVLVAVQLVLLGAFGLLCWLFERAGSRMEAEENANKGMD